MNEEPAKVVTFQDVFSTGTMWICLHLIGIAITVLILLTIAYMCSLVGRPLAEQMNWIQPRPAELSEDSRYRLERERQLFIANQNYGNTLMQAKETCGIGNYTINMDGMFFTCKELSNR